MSESHFSFFYEDIDFVLENQSHVSKWLEGISILENKSLENIEYIFCSDDFLLEINKTHLNHDYYTDIITFPMSDDPLEATIFISIDRVKDNANQFDQAFIDELHRVMAHGLLHLIGFNDKTNEETEMMRQKENHALSQRSFL